MKRKDVESRLILLAKAGSHAYGTNLPSSDTDVKGVCIADMDYYYGFKEFEQKDGGWDDPNDPGTNTYPILDQAEDICVYELRKYLKLAANNNPNILEMLWQKASDYYYLHPVGEYLLSVREEFLSTKIKHSFSG